MRLLPVEVPQGQLGAQGGGLEPGEAQVEF